MLTCQEVTHLVSEGLDRQLPLGQRVGVRMHLMMCKLCRSYKRQLLFLRQISSHYQRKAERDEIPQLAFLSAEARKRIAQAIESNR